MRWWTTSVALGLAACNGGDDDTQGTDEPIESYACTQIAVGDILDVSAVREEARSLTVGRTPYRVNLLTGVPGFVAFETDGATDLTLLLSDADVAAAWWDGGDRVAFEPGEPNPGCDADIAEVQQITTSGGPAWLELGPALQGSVWLMLGE
jgi:hypothetical protein